VPALTKQHGALTSTVRVREISFRALLCLQICFAVHHGTDKSTQGQLPRKLTSSRMLRGADSARDFSVTPSPVGFGRFACEDATLYGGEFNTGPLSKSGVGDAGSTAHPALSCSSARPQLDGRVHHNEDRYVRQRQCCTVRDSCSVYLCRPSGWRRPPSSSVHAQNRPTDRTERSHPEFSRGYLGTKHGVAHLLRTNTHRCVPPGIPPRSRGVWCEWCERLQNRCRTCIESSFLRFSSIRITPPIRNPSL
jgi:hypothetical protein